MVQNQNAVDSYNSVSFYAPARYIGEGATCNPVVIYVVLSVVLSVDNFVILSVITPVSPERLKLETSNLVAYRGLGAPDNSNPTSPYNPLTFG